MLRFRLLAVLLLLVFTNTSLFAQLFRNAPRRTVRQPAVTTPAPIDAKEQLQRLTNEIKTNSRTITENDVKRSQRLLLDAVNDIQRRLPREFDRETANDWNETFQLAKLKATLATATPDAETLQAAQNAFYSDKEGILWMTFDGLRTALRRYQTIAWLHSENNYERQLTGLCDNLVQYIDVYSEGQEPGYFASLTEAITWLDDISLVEPRAARLAELTRIACSGVNVRLQAGSGLVSAGFKQEISEELEINEVILGTRVIGDGVLAGTSSAELVISPNRAIIKVLADAALETHTDGSQRMVTLKNHTTGTLRGEKQIIIAADAITTTPARSRANLNAQVSNVRINAGPLVRAVARGQIDSRKEDSLGEASRRAERQMNVQLNERIDPNIAELNEKYQKVRGLLNKSGLFPRVWNLSSTQEQIGWSILLGNRFQPSAPFPAPTVPTTNGLAVQVHQSALNNMLAIVLSGRSIDEEKFSRRVDEFFEETPAFLQRNADVSPAKVSFGTRAPVDVLFVDNKIRVVVQLNDIQVMDNTSRSFKISVEYQIKVENRDGRDVVILEQTEAEAFPIGHQPGTTLSATQMVIRTYLLRRLGALPKRQEAESLDLGGEWQGRGQLVPQFASAENGWLTFVWGWQSAEE